MKTPNNLEDDYRELDLEPGASLEEVKSAYRELVLFWHPDQFHDRPSRLPKAHQKMTIINLAYDRLRKALAQEFHPRLHGWPTACGSAEPRSAYDVSLPDEPLFQRTSNSPRSAPFKPTDLGGA